MKTGFHFFLLMMSSSVVVSAGVMLPAWHGGTMHGYVRRVKQLVGALQAINRTGAKPRTEEGYMSWTRDLPE